MRLKNKKTGEIAELGYIANSDGWAILQDANTEEFIAKYNSLAELNAEWEDAPEEPKYFYCISIDGSIINYEVESYAHESWCKNGAKIIGNYFETKEEAEKAAERLRAWKRLKDKGYRFSKWFTRVEGGIQINVDYCEYDGIDSKCCEDLDLLFFGGEE